MSHDHNYAWGTGSAAVGSGFTTMVPAGFNNTAATSKTGSGVNNMNPYRIVNYIVKI